MKVNFLDTTAILENDHIETELYIKPTSSLSYLHRSSCHPLHVFKSLPYGEFLRTRRNCSTLESFDRFAIIIKEAFLKRGYNADELDHAITKARSLDRKSLLKPKDEASPHNNTQQSDDPAFPQSRDCRIILNHHPDSANYMEILNKNWSILGTSNLTQHLHEGGLKKGTRRNPRIRDILIKASLPVRNKKGHKGMVINVCPKAICFYCDSIDTSGEIKSNTLDRKFATKKHVCCRSSNVVYCLECKTCGMQYVGETLRPFRKRLYEHSRNVRKKKLDDPIGAHFNSPGHSGGNTQIKSYILAFITKPPKSEEANKMRKKFENSWVYKLRTSIPYGLNSKD